MNLMLNKIDTDLRRKVNEKTKEGKVHSKSSVNISKDEEKNQDKTFEYYIENEKSKKEKSNMKELNSSDKGIEVKVEITITAKNATMGTFLDVKK